MADLRSVCAAALTFRNHRIQCKVRNHGLIGDRSRFEKDYLLKARPSEGLRIWACLVGSLDDLPGEKCCLRVA